MSVRLSQGAKGSQVAAVLKAGETVEPLLATRSRERPPRWLQRPASAASDARQCVGHSQVVQSDKRVRLYSSRRRLEGHLPSHLCCDPSRCRHYDRRPTRPSKRVGLAEGTGSYVYHGPRSTKLSARAGAQRAIASHQQADATGGRPDTAALPQTSGRRILRRASVPALALSRCAQPNSDYARERKKHYSPKLLDITRPGWPL